MPAGTTTVTVVATANDTNAEVVLDPVDGVLTVLPNSVTINITAEDGTTNEEYTVAFTLATTGIAKNNISVNKIYPNPANGNVTFSSKDFKTIEMFNIIGQSVLKLNPTKSNITVNTNQFDKGIYIVKFSNNELSLSKKLIIK